MTLELDRVLGDARACRHCENDLPAGARPILQVHPGSRILIASQAPGRIAHESGVPFQDPSGRRLREWMGLDDEAFYEPRNVAIVPMGFCYPGKGQGGDAPPRPECAPLWRDRLLEQLPAVRLTLLIGRYAQAWHLGEDGRTVSARARAWLKSPGPVVPLPHPSPRNNAWLARNAWFEVEVLPQLRSRIDAALGARAGRR